MVLMLLNLKTYYKASVITSVWHWHRQSYGSMKQKRELKKKKNQKNEKKRIQKINSYT